MFYFPSTLPNGRPGYWMYSEGWGADEYLYLEEAELTTALSWLERFKFPCQQTTKEDCLKAIARAKAS